MSISSLAQTRVYYTVSDGSFNSLNDQLRSIPLSGGAEATVYSNNGSGNFAASPTQIAYDAAGDRVFVANAVANAPAIYVVSASGTSTLFKTIASIPSATSTVVTGMVVDNVGGYLYYNLSDNAFGNRLDQLRRIPLAGGNEETFVGSNTANFPATPQALALDRQNNRLLTTNGVSSTVANREGNNLYVSAIDLNSRAVTKAFTFTEISSGGTTVTTTQGGIAVNSTDNMLYYIVRDIDINTFNDQLRRIPLGGGTEQIVVDVNSNGRGFPTSPGFLAYDAANNRVLVHDININNRDIVAVTPAGAITTLLNDGAQIGSANTSIVGIAVGATAAAPPTVTTAAAASITGTSAVLGGNVTADGGSAVTSRGIVYSSSNTTPAIGGSGVTQDANGSGTGAFSKSLTGLSAGTTYYVRAYATNSTGTSYGTTVSFTTPALPTITQLSPTSGPVGTSVVITGTGFSGTTALTFNGSPAASFTVNSTTQITATVPTGATTGNVRVTTSAGSSLAAAANVFTVTLPATTVTSIVPAGANLTNASTVQFTVTFASSITGITSGNFTTSASTGITGSSVASVSGSGTTYTVTVNTGSGSGTLGLTLASDNGLTPSVSNEPFTGTPLYTIDKTAPSAPVVTTPANGSILATTTPAYTGTAEANATVTVLVDGSTIGTTTASGSGSWIITQPTALAQGSHTVRATATDAAGNTSPSSNTNTFLVDTTRPSVAISSPAGASGSITTTTPIPFRITFSESVTGFGQGALTVTGGSISGFSGSGSTYTFTVTPSANGAVTVNVAANVAQDQAGNGNTAATPFSIQYNQPQTPAPVVVTPVNNSSVATNQPTYGGTAAANSTVTVYVDGSSRGTTSADASGNWTLRQPTALTTGSHTVYATAQLNGQAVSGNSTTNTFTVTDQATYVSSTAEQLNTGSVQVGSTNQEILRVAVVISGNSNPLSAQALTFTTNGSTRPADIAAARVYYTGTSGTLSTATLLGSAVPTPSGSFSVMGSQPLTSGTNYFFLVYDVAASAAPGNALDATLTGLTIGGTAYVPSVTNPVGSRRIISTSRIAGTALRLLGGSTPGYVDFSASATAAPLLGPQYTQVAWIKPTLGSGNTTYYVLGNGTDATAAPYLAITGNGRVEAGFGTGTAVRSVQTGPQTISTNTWHQVAATFTGNVLTLYLNGNAIASYTSLTAEAPGSSRVAYVGSADPTSDNFFPGDIDEVSQWNRALSTTELRLLQHLTLNGTETGLVSYLQFNDTGSTTTDGVGGSVGVLAKASRVSSTAPVGAGVSSLQSVTSTGSYSFAGTSAAIAFTTVSGAPYDVVVTRLDGTPLGTPVADASLRSIYSRAYWVVDKYSTSNFAATITYTLEPGLLRPVDATAFSLLKLYKRGSNSDGEFEAPISATAANPAAGTVSFPVTSFSQTVIGTYGSSPLPVELVRFRAEASGAAAVLRWTTSQELSNDRFEVQRSPDGRVFTTVGTVAGAGTSTVAHSYTFTDAQAGQAGRQVHYRLRQVDTDGQASLSSVEVVRFGGAPRLVLWPNPATDRLTLDLSSFPEARYTVQVTDALGRPVLTTQVTPTPATPLAVAELPAGSYMLHVLGTDSRSTYHFIKQK